MDSARLYNVEEGVGSQFIWSATGPPVDVDDVEGQCMRRRIPRLNEFQKLSLLQTISTRDELAKLFTADTAHDHHYVPFCIELETDELVLVSVGRQNNDKLMESSFFYAQLRMLAQRVLVVPAGMASDFVNAVIKPALRERQQHGTLRVFQTFMVGRCGSTLLTRAIDAAAPSHVISFREPLCYENLFPLLYKSGKTDQPDGELACTEDDLMRQRDWSSKSENFAKISHWSFSCTAFILHYAAQVYPNKDCVFIKHRLPVIPIAINILLSWPNSTGLFSTRQAEGSVESQLKIPYSFNREVYEAERNTDVECVRLEKFRRLDAAGGWFNWLPKWALNCPVRHGYAWFYASRYGYATDIAEALTAQKLISHTATYEQITEGKTDFVLDLVENKLDIPLDNDAKQRVNKVFDRNSQGDMAVRRTTASENDGEEDKHSSKTESLGTQNDNNKPARNSSSWFSKDDYEKAVIKQTLACKKSQSQ